MRRSLLNLRRNPNIEKDLPIKQLVKDDNSFAKKKLLYVCGLGTSGSLGLARYYKQEDTETPKWKDKHVSTSSFRKLATFSGPNKIRDVACGYGFTVIAASMNESSHSAFGFGLNTHSQLGYHHQNPGRPLEVVSKPSPIVLPTTKNITKVACGRSHTILLDQDGRIFSIGNNSLGQCGRPIDPKEGYFGSKRVHEIDKFSTEVTSIVCGQDHTLFVTTNGKVYSCGWGADGQTGLGHYNNESNPTKVKGDIKGVRIVKVSSCCDTVLALDEAGNVFGWGNSEYSQFRTLANDESEQFNVPRILRTVDVPGKIVDIAAGGTICAVLNDSGQVYVWGFGILGKGPNVEHSSKPTLIPESLFGMNVCSMSTKVVKIFAGHSQLAAVTNQGDLYMWGKNRAGNLGFPHRKDQFFPLKVDMKMASVKTVALGIDHTCAIVEKIC